MKKCIVLLVFSLYISESYGITYGNMGMDTIPKPTKQLPVAPNELQQPTKPLPVPPDEPAQNWTPATPNIGNNLIREKNRWNRVIDQKWHHGNQGFNISFRHIIGNNLILASEGVSNWFAACGTLSGLYDQVQIRQQEVIAKQGYWDQFKHVYGRKDVSVFNDFGFNFLEMQIDENSAYELALIMDYCGPLVIISKEKDVAVVVSEIDYSTVGLHPYRVYAFDPANAALAKGKSHNPVYGNTNYDRTLTEFRSLIYLLKAHDNQGPASVYLAINGDFDRSTGINQRALSPERHSLMREIVQKYKNR